MVSSVWLLKMFIVFSDLMGVWSVFSYVGGGVGKLFGIDLVIG